MQAQRREGLADIVAISRRMLDRARAGEWEEAAMLECQRRELVHSYFNVACARHEADEVAAGIRMILLYNNEISELGEICKASLSADLQQNKQGRAAAAAYLNCSR
jgi:hypothetical protein